MSMKISPVANEDEGEPTSGKAAATAKTVTANSRASEERGGPNLSLSERCLQDFNILENARKKEGATTRLRGEDEPYERDENGKLRLSFQLQSFVFRNRSSVRSLDRFNSKPFLKILSMSQDQRELFFTEAGARFPSFDLISTVWMSEWRMAFTKVAGLNYLPALFLYRFAWIAGSLCYIMHLYQVEGSGAGAWLLLFNYIVLNGVQVNVVADGYYKAM